MQKRPGTKFHTGTLNNNTISLQMNSKSDKKKSTARKILTSGRISEKMY